MPKCNCCVPFILIYTCVYASLVLDIFSPSSGGLGACTFVV